MTKDFIELLRKTLPEDEEIRLTGIPGRLKRIYPDYNIEQYGYPKLLKALQSYPDDVKIIELEEFTPPLYNCILLPRREIRKSIATAPVVPAVKEGELGARVGITIKPKNPTPTPTLEPEQEEIPIPIVPVVKADSNEPVKYGSLYGRYRNQPAKEVFAFFPWGNNGNNWDFSFERIAHHAQDENWESGVNGKFAVLKSYLNETFLRVQSQGKILYSENKQRACFNTGLQTSQQKDVILLFEKSYTENVENDVKVDWTFIGVIDSYSQRLSEFGATPEIPTYIEKVDDLVFNLEYEIETNLLHIVDENKDRLPALLRNNPSLARQAIQGAILNLKSQIARNYKMAIPHWFQNKVQLLIPLILNDDGNIDAVLVADRDDDMKMYRFKTILTKEMAYTNARVLCRLDQDWITHAFKSKEVI